MNQVSYLLQVLDYVGIAVFAATGALAASRKQLDIVAFIFFATVTAIGGGTLRDMLLDVPVFWVRSPLYLAIPLAIAVLVYFTAHLVESRYRVLLWADADRACRLCGHRCRKDAECGRIKCRRVGTRSTYRDLRRRDSRYGCGRAFGSFAGRALHHSGLRRRSDLRVTREYRGTILDRCDPWISRGLRRPGRRSYLGLDASCLPYPPGPRFFEALTA